MTPDVPDSRLQIAGQLHPTPPLLPEKKRINLRRFVHSHRMEENEWDTEEEIYGHLVLEWTEPAMGLRVVAALGESSFTVDIARFSRTNGGGWRRRQRICVENDYNHHCRDLTTVLAEIRLHRDRRKEKSA